ncbi:hypothetical protein GCM10010112_67990 [Actinoplanes lobatus]|uniref:Uncharacterized protein n=1 Tax=Actinoplanes lobatus TaxID=113568 RepID=A0A7W7HEL0_9ACTN|nr:hypothetical protein [Actinoplanes lobatus]MBB4749121.1 hypothetical protein [Actinoplanes lobatus]GGN86422.1 hypothetical protein GCM10010112_67990 [Actinoplanes lobatus]GIE42781.1 hypothetical protein Alo02nite_56790 [Actinoplanes lobatus]
MIDVTVTVDPATGSLIITLDPAAAGALEDIIDAADLRSLAREPESRGLDDADGAAAAAVGRAILAGIRQARGH